MENMKIRIADIKTAPWNARKNITPKSVEDLAESIRETGLINPITLWGAPDCTMYCIAGNRRLAALRSIGRNDIVEGVDFTMFNGNEMEARQVTITENLQREDVGVLEEAALVESLVDTGMTAHQIAAQIGRPESWVNRRKKLLALDDAWKERAEGMTADALERIAEYPADVQKSVAKKFTYPVKTWNEVASYFNREQRNLDGVKFDTSECRACMQRTGQNTDLFGEVEEDGLGKCLCSKCFERRRREYVQAQIDNATEGVDEVVRVQYAWQVPHDCVDERDAVHPCAYVFVCYTDEVVVKWGESKKKKDEREAKEREEREAANAEVEEKRNRMRGIVNQLSCAFDELDDEGDNESRISLEKELRKRIKGDTDSETDGLVRLAMDALADNYSFRSNDEWAEICRSLPFFPKVAGLSEDEVNELLNEYPAGEDE